MWSSDTYIDVLEYILIFSQYPIESIVCYVLVLSSYLLGCWAGTGLSGSQKDETLSWRQSTGRRSGSAVGSLSGSCGGAAAARGQEAGPVARGRRSVLPQNSQLPLGELHGGSMLDH